MGRVVSARTVSIPTHAISTTDFNLTAENAEALYTWGNEAASAFFDDPVQQTYLNSFGHAVAPAAAGATEAPLPASASTT
jgi:hypothetical protein